MGKKSRKINKRLLSHDAVNIPAMFLLCFVVGVIPLLVRITPVEISMASLSWDTGQTTFYDTFSMVKANTIILCGVLSTLALVYGYIKKDIQLGKDVVPYITLIMMITTVVSTLNAYDVTTAMTGFLERYEGMWVLIAYSIIFLLAYYQNWEGRLQTYFINAFLISNIILSLIGIGQAFGHDLLLSEGLRPLITSSAMADLNIFMTDSVEDGITQTLYHYNYVGFYITLSFPFFLSLTIKADSRIRQIIYGFTALLILFNLFASTARGGLLGVLVASLFIFFFNRDIILKQKKIAACIVAIALIVFIIFESISGWAVTSRLRQAFTNTPANYQLQSIENIGDDIIFNLEDNNTFTIHVTSATDTEWNYNFTFNGETLTYEGINDESKMYFDEPELHDIYIYYTIYDDRDDYHLTVQAENTMWPFAYTNGNLMYRNTYGNYVFLDAFTTTDAFDQYENFASARGYIWSRALPLISSHMLLGYGPDNFALVFPQNDYVGKLHVYKTTNMIVDKAHNLYLQMILSTGVITLLAFISLIVLFIKRLWAQLALNHFIFDSAFKSGIASSLIGYFISAFFNDSTVHVSPVFWVMFGITLSLFTMPKQT